MNESAENVWLLLAPIFDPYSVITDKFHVNSPTRKAAFATNTLRTRLVYDFLTKERLCFIVPIRLSRQLEFEVETEVLHRGGEGGRGEERTVHLTFVVGRDGEETRYGIVC